MTDLKPGVRVTYRSTSNKLNGRSGVISGPEHPLLGFPVDFKGMPAGIYCSKDSLELKGEIIMTEWTAWLAHTPGTCPIPDVKEGEWQFKSSESPDGVVGESGPCSYEEYWLSGYITDYRFVS
jgi:hypothetical protein